MTVQSFCTNVLPVSLIRMKRKKAVIRRWIGIHVFDEQGEEIKTSTEEIDVETDRHGNIIMPKKISYNFYKKWGKNFRIFDLEDLREYRKIIMDGRLIFLQKEKYYRSRHTKKFGMVLLTFLILFALIVWPSLIRYKIIDEASMIRANRLTGEQMQFMRDKERGHWLSVETGRTIRPSILKIIDFGLASLFWRFALLCLLPAVIFAYYLWPTPVEELRIGQTYFTINRLTGEVWLKDMDWVGEKKFLLPKTSKMRNKIFGFFCYKVLRGDFLHKKGVSLSS